MSMPLVFSTIIELISLMMVVSANAPLIAYSFLFGIWRTKILGSVKLVDLRGSASPSVYCIYSVLGFK